MGKKEKEFEPNLPANREVKPPVIDGKQFKPWQWEALQLYVNPDNIANTAKELLDQLHAKGYKVSISALTKLQTSDKWRSMVDFYAELSQENLYVNLMSKTNILFEALIKIWKGEWPEDDKNANAVVASFREIVRLGKRRVDPLSQIKSKEIDININKEETINVNLIHKILPHLEPEERIVFGRTGEIPDRLKHFEQVIDVEAEEID